MTERNLWERCRGRLWVRIGCGVYWAVLLVATHWPGLTEENTPDFGALPFDKTMHVLTFAGLAMWLTWSKWFDRWGWRGNAVAAVVIGLVYGGIEEITQPYFDRTAAWDDWLADFIGLSAGALIGLGIAKLVSSLHAAGDPREAPAT